MAILQTALKLNFSCAYSCLLCPRESVIRMVFSLQKYRPRPNIKKELQASTCCCSSSSSFWSFLPPNMSFFIFLNRSKPDFRDLTGVSDRFSIGRYFRLRSMVRPIVGSFLTASFSSPDVGPVVASLEKNKTCFKTSSRTWFQTGLKFLTNAWMTHETVQPRFEAKNFAQSVTSPQSTKRKECLRHLTVQHYYSHWIVGVVALVSWVAVSARRVTFLAQLVSQHTFH